jgi:hypothetical protein
MRPHTQRGIGIVNSSCDAARAAAARRASSASARARTTSACAASRAAAISPSAASRAAAISPAACSHAADAADAVDIIPVHCRTLGLAPAMPVLWPRRHRLLRRLLPRRAGPVSGDTRPRRRGSGARCRRLLPGRAPGVRARPSVLGSIDLTRSRRRFLAQGLTRCPPIRARARRNASGGVATSTRPARHR